LANEAYYYRAKALVQAGQMQHAQNDWEVLAKDTRNVYGAEAKYLLAQQLFDSGKFDAVEEEVLEFVDAGTPHVYWMARSFILLSDAYVKLDRKLEARQYLLSLKQNYQADDDISSMIESRLENLKEEQQNVTE
jgi:TolA-binding protein